MNYNLGQLEELFEQVKELLDYAIDKKLTNKNYYMFLANLPQGEKLEYELTKEALPHLLGINTTYLVSTGLFSSKNSYWATMEMLEDPYKVHNAAKSGIISYDKLFSKHIDKKIKCFKDNLTVNAHDIEFICKYDKTRTYSSGVLGENYEYIIVKKYEDGSIGLLCIAKNINGIYNPMSSQLLVTDEEKEATLGKLLTNQEITLVNAVQIMDFKQNNATLTFDEQKDRIYSMRAYKDKYNCSIDTNNNFIYSLNMLKDNRTIFSQSEDASTIMEQSRELERIRKELDEYRGLKTLLETKIIQLSAENEELQTQVSSDSEFKTKLIKLVKELDK